jgi:hypothetical protein
VAFASMMGDFVGLDSFVSYLRGTGRNARIALPTEVPWLESTFFDQHKQLVLVEGRAIDVISIRLQGSIGPRQNLLNRAFTINIGPVPIASNQTWPLQYNYIVRGPDQFALRAKLKTRTQGFFNREKRAIFWSGGALADVLAKNEALMADLFEFLDLNDELEVQPETAKGYTRIIHKTTMELRYNLLSDEIVSLFRGKLPEPLLASIETIASAINSISK